MKIYVKAKPGSRKEFVKKVDDTHFVVAVKEPPIGGKANRAVIRSLAEYFHIKPYEISFVFGEKTKNKIFEVPFNNL